MPEYGVLVDIGRCVGCRACELACREENQLPEETRWIRMIKTGPEMVDGSLVMHFVPLACMHCGKAPCVEVCPTKAISKRADGIGARQHNVWVCHIQPCGLKSTSCSFIKTEY